MAEAAQAFLNVHFILLFLILSYIILYYLTLSYIILHSSFNFRTISIAPLYAHTVVLMLSNYYSDRFPGWACV